MKLDSRLRREAHRAIRHPFLRQATGCLLGLLVASSGVFAQVESIEISDSQIVRAGEPASFTATIAPAVGVYTFQWLKDDDAMAGETLPSLSFAAVTNVDAGIYRLEATSNDVTTSSDPVVLEVTSPQPPAVALYFPAEFELGSAIYFDPLVSSELPVSYEWTKDGEFLSNERWLYIPQPLPEDAGVYRFTATNELGSVSRGPFTLVPPVPEAPRFNSVSSSESILEGRSFSIYAQALGTPPFTFEFIREGVTLKSVVDYSSASLEFPSFSATDEGTYSVQITNTAGTTISDPLNLRINRDPYFLRIAPGSRLLRPGDMLRLVAYSNSPRGPRYQWFRNGILLPGETSYVLEGRFEDLGPGNYHVEEAPESEPLVSSTVVIVQNDLPAIQSGVTLSTTAASSGLGPIAPIILRQPESEEILEGGIVSRIGHNAVVFGKPTPSFQWFKDGAEMPNSTDHELTIFKPTPANAGTYHFVATNAAGSVISDPLEVTVQPHLLQIRRHPETVNLIAGVVNYLSVEVEGPRRPFFQWFKDDIALGAPSSSVTSHTLSGNPSSAGVYYVVVSHENQSVRSRDTTVTFHRYGERPTVTSISGDIVADEGFETFLRVRTFDDVASVTWFRNGELEQTIANRRENREFMVRADTVGTWTAEVTTAYGTSVVGPLSVEFPNVTSLPVFTLQSGGSTLANGDEVTLVGSARGTQPITYQWFLDGEAIPEATQSTFEINSFSVEDAGTYHVTATNALGETISREMPLILSPDFPPRIITPPSSLFITASSIDNQELSVTVADDFAQRITYEWFKIGAPGGPASVGHRNRLDLLPFEDPVGDYFVVVTSEFGSATSQVVSVTFPVVPELPEFETQPEHHTVYPTDPATFSVNVTSSNALTYQWFINHQPVAGATNPTFTLGSVQRAHHGVVEARVSDGTVTVSSQAGLLNVIEPVPVNFVLQPVDIEEALGNAVQLTVETGGDPAPSIQWIKDGRPLAGANQPTLSLPNLSLADVGDYYALATNRFDHEVSRRAQVQITGARGYALGTHEIVGHGLNEARQLTIENTLTVTGDPTTVTWESLLPAGWELISSTAPTATVNPTPSTTSLATWAWSTPTNGAHEFTYTLQAPDDVTVVELSAMLTAVYSDITGETLARPDPLQLGPAPSHHTADTDRNGRLSLSELLRVIELYNTRNGSSRTGIYRLDETTPDGFQPDSSLSLTERSLPFRRHLADSDRDGALSLSELLRVIELYNTRSGTTRTGAYQRTAGSADGFAPAVGP